MSHPPMTARIVEQSDDRLVLAVEHDEAQSFSRAVDPKAMRTARQIIRGTWAVVDVDYAATSAGRRCVSLFTYNRRSAT